MEPSTVDDIVQQLRWLPSDKLTLVADFVAALTRQEQEPDQYALLLATESSLREDWDRPEEDAAWARL